MKKPLIFLVLMGLSSLALLTKQAVAEDSPIVVEALDAQAVHSKSAQAKAPDSKVLDSKTIASSGINTGSTLGKEVQLGDYLLAVVPIEPVLGAQRVEREELQIRRKGELLDKVRGGRVFIGNPTRSSALLASSSKPRPAISMAPSQEPYTHPGSALFSDGIPTVVLTEFTGVGECCLTVHLYQLGAHLKKLATIDARYAPFTNFFRHEQKLYYYANDYSFGGWGNGADLSRPAIEVQLAITNQGMSLALDRMKLQPLSAEEIRGFGEMTQEKLKGVEPTHRGSDLPSELVERILRSLYGGNPQEIVPLINAAWPAGRPGKQFIWPDILRQLEQSSYWHELKPLAMRVTAGA